MNKIKITLDEWTEIGQYNHAAKWLRPFCRYDLIKEADGRFKREQRIGLFVYFTYFYTCSRYSGFLVYVGWWLERF